MKIYQRATNAYDGPVKVKVRVIDGETHVSLPNAPDILILREGRSVDILVSASSPHAGNIILMLDVDAQNETQT